MTANSARLFEPADVLSYQLITDAQVAPNGQWAAFSVETLDWETDSVSSALWIVDTQGGEPRLLTPGTGAHTTPRWSPDSRQIAFVSTRDGSAQLFVLPVDGGEARQLTSLPGGAAAHAWSPDGSQIAFTSAVLVDPEPEDPGARARWENRPRVIRRAFYKIDGAGYSLESFSQLFTVSTDGGEAMQLTSGAANVFAPAWSPDGSRIAYTKSRDGALDSHCSDLWTIPANGGIASQVTTSLEACASPSWSPDGKTIAFTGNEDGADAAQYLWTVPAEGGEPANIMKSLDRPLGFVTLGSAPAPLWTPDGTAVYALVADHGNHQLARIALDGEVVYLTQGAHQLTLLSADASCQLFGYVACTTGAPRELFSLRERSQSEQQLTDINASWGAGRAWPTEHSREFRGPNGAVYGRLLLPARGVAPYPLLVDVHGGPHSQSLLSFEHHPYRFMLASRGWAVLMLDPRGSTSFGGEYSDALRGHWGELDFPEFEAAVDQLVAEGTADADRLAIYGKSYGGFMSAYTLGQTNRYRAAVVSAPVTNAESHFGTSDTGYFVDPAEMGGDPQTAADSYRASSPLVHLRECGTPALLLHGEADQRTPLGQSEELYHRLLALGCETELVLYPGGDHHVLEQGLPSHRVDYNRRVVDWLERHAGPATPAM